MLRKLSENPTMKEVKKHFVIHLLAIALICGGHYSMISLQTTLYVEDGLGANTLTIHFAFTIVSSMISSSLIQIFSLKSGVIYFDISVIIYCCANFYPEIYTLIPASIICGLGKSLFWICLGCYTVHFSKLFETCGSKSYDSYSSSCTGYVFSAFCLSQVIANVISYILLETSDPNNIHEAVNLTEQMLNSSEVMKGTDASRYLVSDVCGAKDCQDPRVNKQNISSYVPPDPTILYIVFSIFVIFSLLGLLLHLLFMSAGPKSDKAIENNKACEEVYSNKAFSYENTVVDICAKYEGKNDFKNAFEIKPSACMRIAIMNMIRTVRLEFLSNFRHFLKADQLLLSGLQFYTGMSSSFVTGELTRGYVSCVHGVSKVGVWMAIYNTVTFVVSIVNGKVCGKWGRKYSVIFAFLCNIGTYIFCLLWVPTETSSFWTICVLFFVCGIHDSIWLTTTSAAVAVFFPDCSSRGFTWWSIMLSCSFVVQYAWSTSVCVSFKIYVLLAALFLSVFTQLIAEYRHTANSLLMRRKGNKE